MISFKTSALFIAANLQYGIQSVPFKIIEVFKKFHSKNSTWFLPESSAT